MLEIYACTAVFCLVSIVVGATLLSMLGWRRPLWLAGAAGFAALVTVAPFLIRLPGRATTAAVLIGILAIAGAALAWRRRDAAGPARRNMVIGAAAALCAVALASLPFLFQDHLGVLGEGIYINDHAAQLYWTDWLQHGFGPEPNAVAFGYPIGPQALVATVASATGIDLISVFNGLLLAIPALTAIAALAALRDLPALARIPVAALAAMCFLAASFLAQSAFKETAMALFVLAFAIALQQRRPARGVIVIGLTLAAASVLTYSLPGLAWFAIALAIWLALEAVAGRSPIDYRAAGEAIPRHWAAVGLVGVAAVVVAVLAIGPASNFVEKIDDVQQSQGRLGSPVFPGEVFGIWPEGDYRIVRGEVSGSLLAAGLGFLAAAFGAWALWRGRQLALLAMLATGTIVYAGSRLVAQIHVEAKALAVIAPLVLLVALRALLARRSDGEGETAAYARYAVGAVVALAALGSTLVALRATPVGYADRGEALEQFAQRIDGDPVVFLGVDRFAGYYLRGTLARAPAGYVPEEVASRSEKPWFQGRAVDFDSLDAGKLDQFKWAITTAAAFNSTPPANFTRVAQDGDYVLWRRDGPTPQARIVAAEDPLNTNPVTTAFELSGSGGTLACHGPAGERLLERGDEATVLGEPTLVASSAWNGERVEPAAGGQERGFTAESPISVDLNFLRPGTTYELSLQYHSQVPLEVFYDGEPVGELPPSLDGMYLDGAGRGAFWPAGELEGRRAGLIEIVPEAPDGLRDALGVEQRVWLGTLAAAPTGEPREVSLADACGKYVDHFTLDRRGRG